MAGDLLAKRQAPELKTRRWSLKPGDATPIVVLPIPWPGWTPFSTAAICNCGRAVPLPWLWPPGGYDGADSRLPASLAGDAAQRQAQLQGTQPNATGVQERWCTPGRWRSDRQQAGPAITIHKSSRYPMPFQPSRCRGRSAAWNEDLSAPDRCRPLNCRRSIRTPPGPPMATTVTYDLSLPLINDGDHPANVELALESPLKSTNPATASGSRTSMTGPVMCGDRGRRPR